MLRVLREHGSEVTVERHVVAHEYPVADGQSNALRLRLLDDTDGTILKECPNEEKGPPSLPTAPTTYGALDTAAVDTPT
jgi:hypothetical protein